MVAQNANEDANQVAEVHLEAYSSHFRVCIGKLRSIWKQVGNDPDECRSQVVAAAEQALAAWTQAVEKAEADKHSIKALIQQHSSEIATIKSELDDGVDSQSMEAEFGSGSSGEGEATLLKTLDILKGTLQFWRVKRTARVQAYEALMEVHLSLKRQLGLRHKPEEDVDITTGALEYLQMENGKLIEEKGLRVVRAEEQLDKLRAICRELGEDCAAAAAEVHPALSSLSAEKESAEVLGCVYKLVGSPSKVTAGGDLDLSDAMFERLAFKIADMQRLKVDREAQSRDVLEMLGSLWDALSIPEDAPERSMVAKMLSPDRPQRLHKRTLDKCLAEVNRLEGCKAQAMRDLALSKARELEQLCISTRISPPHTGPLLAELDKPGQMTHVLSKLVRLVAEVQALAAKRAPILVQAQELLAAQADSAWLRSYNQNENRYKGRDASRNMQRAIKASKLRDRLGPMMESLLAALADWELEEGGPFLYDEQVLQLRVVEAELEQLALEKAPKPKSSLHSSVSASSGGGGVAAACGKPPAAGGRSAAGTSGSSTRSSSMAGAGGGAAPRATSSTGGGGSGGGGSGGGNSSSGGGSTTPRSVADAVRRMSLAPPVSARDNGVFRSSSSTNSNPGAATASKVMRSNDFSTGALRSLSQQQQQQHFSSSGASENASQNPNRLSLTFSSSISSAAAAAAAAGRSVVSQSLMSLGQTTPPGVRRTATAAAAAVACLSPTTAVMVVSPSPVRSKAGLADDIDDAAAATTSTASCVKNTAQELFRRYLGDSSEVSSKPTPTKGATYADAKPAKLNFSELSPTGADDDDDGADDVRATKCDTPKSTASSRSKQALQPPPPLQLPQHYPQPPQQPSKSGKTPPHKSGSVSSPTVVSPCESSKPSRIPRVRM
ncbi:hypothetical protein Vretimale_194 [Volvox reticuliferus]|uniref:Uncharacterized protein n=1 Tax=Volvox reticuliferus TaxID=1737510 RepID=A0A8J4D281_9CHLO|nr:hypothetical protein Vretimale_194 [Volvox reticuliferus]